jgi:protein O-mannosyl-transferase
MMLRVAPLPLKPFFSRTGFSSTGLGGAALVMMVAIAYTNALHGGFQFDDYNVIVDNSAVHSWSAWWHSMPGIRPLLKLSYTANWLAGPAPAGFIAFNIVCHALNSLLVFGLCRRLFATLPNLYVQPNRFAPAFIAALIFALHPAQTEAVTYICGRSVVLMSLFYLAAAATGCSESRGARQCWSPLFFGAALLTKETSWTLPLALLLIDGLRGKPYRESIRRLWPHGLTLAAVGTAMLAVGGYRQLLAHSIGLRGPLSNLAAQVDGVFYLATQPLVLLHTNIDPDLPASAALDALWSIKLIVLVALLIIGCVARRSWSGFAILWFVIHLLPTNSLLPRNDIANDRQLYLALIGPALWVVHGLLKLAPPRMVWIGAAPLVFFLGTATMLRNDDYRDEVSLWQATARASPHKARVWNNLGYAYQLAGRYAQARAAYRYALTLDPKHNRARINNWLLQDGATGLRQ